MQLISRKIFLKSILTFAGAAFLFVFGKMLNINRQVDSKLRTPHRIENDFSEGVNFADDFIIVKIQNQINVFSNKCSHLGCKINNAANGLIICPCHRSIYDLNGMVVSGPSKHNLRKLEFAETESNKFLEIKPFL